MKAKSAAIQGGLAVFGLVFAYATWQREPEQKKGDVLLVDASKSDLQKIRYSDDKKWAELSRTEEAGEPRLVLKLSARPEQKQPERELRGNESAQRLYDKFTPLYARRALGVLAADKLKELGLDAPKRKLEITTKGGARTFQIGSPGGASGDPYLRDEKDGSVFLFGSSVIADLESANTRLVERTLHPWKPADLEQVTIAAGGPGGKSRTLTAKPGATALAIKLTPVGGKGTTDKVDEQASGWHEKIWRLLGTDILGKGELPAAGAPSLVVRIDYKVKGGKTGFLEMGRVQPPAPATATAPDGGTPPLPPLEIYVRSESTAGWVKVPATANELLNEAEKIVAAE